MAATPLRFLTVGSVRLCLIRTLRVPGDKLYDLPAGLGNFSLYKVGDLPNPPNAYHPDSYLLCMYDHEAMWVSMRSQEPRALVMGSGCINVVNGAELGDALTNDAERPQSYVVLGNARGQHPQPWLDGHKTGPDEVSQFVAVKLEAGTKTVEEQVTGKAEVGGLQFRVYEPSDEYQAEIEAQQSMSLHRRHTGDDLKMAFDDTAAVAALSAVFGADEQSVDCMMVELCDSAPSGSALDDLSYRGGMEPVRMGLGAGGRITQKIYPDAAVEKGKNVSEVWKHEAPVERVFIHIIHAGDWKNVTGEDPHPSPITKATYERYRIPWFTLADTHLGDTPVSDALANVTPLGEPS